MKLIELSERIQHALASSPARELRAVIPVFEPGSIGGTPCTPVILAGAGIDWDASKFILFPESQLTRLSAEDVAAIRASVSKGQSWHAYQAHKELREQVKTLTAEVQRLTAALAHERERGQWRGIESAPRDRSHVLLKVKDSIPNRPDHGLAGRMLVGEWMGEFTNWAFAAPVGYGGIPDDWLDGWQPLPPPPQSAGTANEEPARLCSECGYPDCNGECLPFLGVSDG